MKKYKKPMGLEALKNIKDRDIDFSDIPELDASFWKKAKIVYPDEVKQQITLRMDADMLNWFKAQGKGYQTRMNAVLRSFYESQHHG